MHAGMHAGIIIDITGRTEKGGLGWKNKGGGGGFPGRLQTSYLWLAVDLPICLPACFHMYMCPSVSCLSIIMGKGKKEKKKKKER